MMWLLWQFMSFSPAPLVLTAMLVQPSDFKKLITNSHSSLLSESLSESLSEQRPSTPLSKPDQEQLTAALSVFLELLRFHQIAGNIAEIATAWFRLGDIYQQIDQFSHALSSYQQAIAHYQLTGDAMGEVNALSHLGKAYETRGWVNCALEHYEQALVKLRQHSEYLDDATTLRRLAACIDDMF
jgi:tetratricopeptide (TPR) repeat protein